MKAKILLGATALLCGHHAFAVSTTGNEPPTPVQSPHVTWVSGLTVMACQTSAHSEHVCGHSDMPVSVGYVQRIIPGNFLAINGATWIVQSINRYSICGFTAGSKAILCQQINLLKTRSKFEINYVDGALYFSLIGRIPDTNDTTVSEFATRFTTALASASDALQRSLSHTAIKSARPTTELPQSVMIPGEGGGTCNYGDEEYECSPSPGRPDEPGGGADNGGAGNGAAPAVGDAPATPPPTPTSSTCIPGPITVCITRPPPPPLVDPVDPPPPLPSQPPISFCGTFGLFCPSNDPPIQNSGPYEERVKQCEFDYEMDLDECQAYRMASDARSYRACKERAAVKLSNCLTKARGKSGD